MSNIENLLSKYHNPNLVDKKKSPNDNTQILLFSDGSIIETKGGPSFLNHKFYVYAEYQPKYKEYSEIYKNNKKINITMPCSYINNLSYSILPSIEIAKKIRVMME